VQKCVARNGEARYQSEPCGRGSRTAEVWDAVPEPETPQSRTPPRPTSQRAAAAPRKPRRARYAQARNVAAADSCEQARAYRDDAERRAGLARNYELLSALQRRVYDACR
jgi:hypothetical protein